MRLKSWVKDILFIWSGVDIFLIVLLLYMLRLVEIGG